MRLNRHHHVSFAKRMLYHGSPFWFCKPRADVNREPCDFNTGFYLSPNFNMAYGRGIETTNKTKRAFVFVMTFEFDDEAEGIRDLKILRFNTDRDWAEFIIRNRSSLPLDMEFDIAVGPSADGNIHQILEDYFANPDREDIVHRLSDNDLGTQYCFHSQSSIDRFLKYVGVKIYDRYGRLLYTG